MTKKSIGQFIAALRKANGMTQQEVADRLNVSNKAVSRWERDECAPDLSAIPALAEMFGVTCDELLRGERIAPTSSTEKTQVKVDKQIKNLINRTISGFETLIWISLAVAVVGLICMFGISYGFYRPVIGFAVMLLFEACALAIAILAVSRTKNVKTDNELFHQADAGVITKFNKTLGNLSFAAFFVIFAVILLSFPLILTESEYLYSVLDFHSYVTGFLVGIILILALVYLMCKKIYVIWITEDKLPQISNHPSAKNLRWMNGVQIALVVIASLIFVLAPYLEFEPTDKFTLFDVAILIGLICLAANIVCFMVFVIKQKENRQDFLLQGIRNILFIPAVNIASQMHTSCWAYMDNSMVEYKLYDLWYPEYLWYAICFALAVIAVFAVIDKIVKRNIK